MPAGPGKFEGEPFSTFVLYQWSMDGSEDESTGDVETSYWAARFNGPIYYADTQYPTEVGESYGYTVAEIAEGMRDLSRMAGAILVTDSQGFVYGYVHQNRDEFEAQWAAIMDETRPDEVAE